jgi:hypothetical protein
MDQPTNDQDKTAQLLKAMTQVRIENAVRQMCASDMLGQIAVDRNERGVTMAAVRKVDLLSGVSARALNARWLDSKRGRKGFMTTQERDALQQFRNMSLSKAVH